MRAGGKHRRKEHAIGTIAIGKGYLARVMRSGKAQQARPVAEPVWRSVDSVGSPGGGTIRIVRQQHDMARPVRHGEQPVEALAPRRRVEVVMAIDEARSRGQARQGGLQRRIVARIGDKPHVG